MQLWEKTFRDLLAKNWLVTFQIFQNISTFFSERQNKTDEQINKQIKIQLLIHIKLERESFKINACMHCTFVSIRHLKSSFPFSLQYSHHHSFSALTTANPQQPCQPMHIRDNLTSSTITIPYLPMPLSISTSHSNLCTKGTLWHHLITLFPLSLDYSQSAPTMQTKGHQGITDII